MPRMKLQLPDTWQFRTKLTVRVSDLNYGNHLGNDSVLSLLHEARVRFWKSFDYTEIDVEGVGTMVTDALIVYKGQAFYGDILTAEIAPGPPEKYGFDLFYHLRDETSGREVARAKTYITFFDFSRQKVAPLPEALRQRIMLL